MKCDGKVSDKCKSYRYVERYAMRVCNDNTNVDYQV